MIDPYSRCPSLLDPNIDPYHSDPHIKKGPQSFQNPRSFISRPYPSVDNVYLNLPKAPLKGPLIYGKPPCRLPVFFRSPGPGEENETLGPVLGSKDRPAIVVRDFFKTILHKWIDR